MSCVYLSSLALRLRIRKIEEYSEVEEKKKTYL